MADARGGPDSLRIELATAPAARGALALANRPISRRGNLTLLGGNGGGGRADEGGQGGEEQGGVLELHCEVLGWLGEMRMRMRK